MRYLSQRNRALVEMMRLERLKKVILCFFILLYLTIFSPSLAEATLQTKELEDGTTIARSLESLRDLDYQTWQLIAYRRDFSSEDVILRIVGYPGTLRLDHPMSLKVHAGLHDWELEDITLSNYKLSSDTRAAAAEFALTPLLNDLTNNRPLRLMLVGGFSELPVPPYLVREWRCLLDDDIQHKQNA